MDDLTNKALELLAISVYVAWHNTLCGNQSQDQNEYYKRLGNPQIGDLVLEITTMHRVAAMDRIGYLEAIEFRDAPGWDDESPAPKEKYWRIRKLDGELFEWSNSRFIVIPENEWSPYKPKAVRPLVNS